MPIKRQDPADMERWYDPTAYQVRQVDKDLIECECGCGYFEQVAVHQFPKIHTVILGQAVPPHRDITFYVFRCMRPGCGKIHEPTVQGIGPDRVRDLYDHFLDQMEGKDIKESEPESKAEVL